VSVSPTMVHAMDACCKQYPADPQRAVLEKVKAQEAAAAQRLDASRKMNELLKKKLAGGSSKADAEELAAPDDADAKYRAELEKQRRKLMDDGSDSDSSLSVHDPFISKRQKKEYKLQDKEKRKREKKERKKAKKEKREKGRRSDDSDDGDKKKKKKKERRRGSDESALSDDEGERRSKKEKKKDRKKDKKRRHGDSGGEESNDEEREHKKPRD